MPIRPNITIAQILKWADAHHQRTGKWPRQRDGAISGPGVEPGLTWSAVHWALYLGNRGLPGGSSLARLLAAKRGVRNRGALKPLTIDQILKWADAHHRRTGKWPSNKAAAVVDAQGERWNAIDLALQIGGRGLRGKSSLAKLLAEQRGKPNPADLPRLTIKRILQWADAHRAQHGRWPNRFSGAVAESPGLTWMNVESALHKGSRGLRGGQTLPKLLLEHRGRFSKAHQKPLSLEHILKWADAHHQRTGYWPNQHSGRVLGAPNETWPAIVSLFKKGHRGLPRGTTLARVLMEHRGVRSKSNAPRLTIPLILEWADAHHRRTGQWPTAKSGLVRDARPRGETWSGVHFALYYGNRGLPGGSALSTVLKEHRGVLNRFNQPPLRITEIMQWARRHHARTGKWPNRFSGRVREAPHNSWQSVEMAVYTGGRGLKTRGRTLRHYLITRCGMPDRLHIPLWTQRKKPKRKGSRRRRRRKQARA